MEHLPLILFVAISVISVITTVYDKIAAKIATRHRVPEATLLLLSILGGSLPMYITMQIIHHKTQHKKFMIGIPVILAVQIVLMILYFYFRK
ncbi:MAG: DUF1294 domain-containing protein [Ruminococcaceae bacterium]|nr:DUF1294 domain-containing protein [Oscillospiraceae bacterium]